jgi:CO/xanthine dehydrogenase Mo-binding subunit
MGIGRDAYGRDGQSRSTVVGFAEVEVDLEIGKVDVVDFLAVADVGTVMHPRNLGGQILGGAMFGVGHALYQKWVYDQEYGVALAKRFYNTRPPSILDAPRKMAWDAVNIPDPETPVGARGVGEPPLGAAYGSVMAAIIDAIGPDKFSRAPVTLDMVLMALEAGKRVHDPLTANI